MSDGDTPVLVGAAECVQRWDGSGDPDDPLSLMARAAGAALADAGGRGLGDAVDLVAVVNTITWSYADAPRELSRRLGIAPSRCVYTTIGGNSPQYLVHRAAEALVTGGARAVLLAGGEAGDALSRARKLDRRFEHWPARAEPEYMDGDQRLGISSIEQAYELFLPSAMYPLMETAIRKASGRSPEEHRVHLGRLFARFAAAAACNPTAWFRQAHTAERIASPTADNRYVGYPYTKLMNAIMAVDQAAALVLTTTRTAETLGIDRARWVYPMGAGDVNDVWHVTERPELYRSPGIRAAATHALAQAGLTTNDVGAFDLYSCFPSAVELAMEALELEPDDPRELTLTGGLPYFGGPGNNYSMHAIVAAVERIRAERATKVFVSGLGWYATKHSVGVYGAEPGAQQWGATDTASEQARIDAAALPPPLESADGRGRIEAFVIRHGRDGNAVDGTVLVRMENGSRTLAAIEATGAELEAMERDELVGLAASVRHDAVGGVNRVRVA